MQKGAELTLRITHRVQAQWRPDISESTALWTIWPRGERVDWDGARALLGRLPKPVLVAPLLEPHMLGLWTVEMLDAGHRQVVGREMANQVQYYADKLSVLRAEDGPVRFGLGAASVEMTRDEFLHWATEYAINVGISLETSAKAGVAHVRVRPAGGGPPLTL